MEVIRPNGNALPWVIGINDSLSKAVERITSKANPVVVITDNASGDQEQAKLLMALAANIPNMQYLGHVEVPPSRTDILAFRLLMLAQVKKNAVPAGTIFYCNVAPIYRAGEKNGHHSLRLLVLKNGHIVIIADTGDSLEHFRSSNFVDESYNINTDQNGLEVLGKIFSSNFTHLTLGNLIDDDIVFVYGGVWDQDNRGNVRLFYSVDLIPNFHTTNSRITILRDGIPVSFGVTNANARRTNRDLDIGVGTNIIEMGSSEERFVDISRAGGMATRQLVLDVKGYGFLDALREVIKVSYAAFRTGGFFDALYAFCSVSRRRFRTSGTPEHTRTPPKITFRLIDLN